MTGNLLVVAFDGLDKELVEEFELENIQQKEFGAIDNQTGMQNIYTSELFASFITGEVPDKHGIEGLTTWSNRRGRIVDSLAPKKLVETTKGFNRIQETLKTLLSTDEVKYSKEHIESETLFEKIDNSRAMYVPGYNPSVFWQLKAETLPLEYGYGSDIAAEFWDTREHEFRKKNFFSELENEIVSPRDFLMIHLHRTDFHQHLYGDPTGVMDRDKLRRLYQETDELAGEILEKAEGKYDTVVFMSDHGLPAEKGHNEKAFYSSNRPLFDETPKITDFHDRILEEASND
jgi:predicted AlkP superfamily pyrophosphatase or phosphodiesterase